MLGQLDIVFDKDRVVFDSGSRYMPSQVPWPDSAVGLKKWFTVDESVRKAMRWIASVEDIDAQYLTWW